MNDKILAILIANVSFYILILAAAYAGPTPFNRLTNQREAASPRLAGGAFAITSMLIAPIAILSLFDQIINPYSTSMQYIANTGQMINTNSNGYFQVVQSMLIPLIAIFVWINRFSIMSLSVSGIYVALKSTTGSRWPIVVLFLWIGILYLYENRKRWPPAWLIAPLFGVWIIFSSLGVDRGGGLRDFLFEYESTTTYSAESEYLKPFEEMDYGNMEFLEYIVHAVPQKSGTYDYFTGHSRILTEPIPRVLWPDKPVGAPFQLVNLWDHGTPIGMTNSVGGTGWLDFGWIGVLLWSVVFGSIYGAAYKKFAESDSRFWLIIYTGLAALALQFFRDGLPLTVLRFSFVVFLPVIIWHFFDARNIATLEAARRKRVSLMVRRRPDIAAKILARQRGAKRSMLGRNS